MAAYDRQFFIALHLEGTTLQLDAAPSERQVMARISPNRPHEVLKVHQTL